MKTQRQELAGQESVIQTLHQPVTAQNQELSQQRQTLAAQQGDLEVPKALLSRLEAMMGRRR